MSAEPTPLQQQRPSRLPLWRIVACLGCLAVCLGIILTSPKPANHQNSLFELVDTIGNAGPLRQILMALFFCLAIGATIMPKTTKVP